MMTRPQYPPDEYSSLEQERIEKLRLLCADLDLTEEQKSDAYLIKWLRARSLNVNKALEMLKSSLEWRRENNIDGIQERENVPLEFEKMAPYANLGLDNEGYPIFLVPVGRHDSRTLLETYGMDTVIRYTAINCEKFTEMFRELSKEQGRSVTQIVEIMDFEGYSFRQITSKLCRDYMVRMQTTFDSNYPEMLRHALIINAPKVFSILFNMMKPFVPKETLKKISIFGPEPEKWKKAIAERFPLEQIPLHWGGTRQGSDEYCSKDDIWKPGPVPKSFFTHGIITPSSDDDSELTIATINARDSLKLSLNVVKHNSSIVWRLRADSYDIGFQITFQNDEVVVPFSRIQSQKEMHEGSHLCSELGTYTVIFDNTYSLTRSKIVYYYVSVIQPEEGNINPDPTS